MKDRILEILKKSEKSLTVFELEEQLGTSNLEELLHILNEMEVETSIYHTNKDKYNKEHKIVPKTIIKEIREVVSNIDNKTSSKKVKRLTKQEKLNEIERIETEMMKAAKELDFERAMELRNILFEMKVDSQK